MTKIKEFKQEANNRLRALSELVHAKLEPKGIKEEDCQQLCLLNAIAKVEHLVNGTVTADLVGPGFIIENFGRYVTEATETGTCGYTFSRAFAVHFSTRDEARKFANKHSLPLVGSLKIIQA